LTLNRFLLLLLLLIYTFSYTKSSAFGANFRSSDPAEIAIKSIDDLIAKAEEFRERDPKLSFQLGEEAIQLSLKNNYWKGLALGYLRCGEVHFAIYDNYPQALEFFTQAESISRKHGLKVEQALSNNHIGLAYFSMKDNYELALQYLQKALSICEQTDNFWALGAIQNNIAFLNQTIGDLDKAEYYYKLSIDSNRKTTHTDAVALSLTGFAEMLQLRGKIHESLSYAREGLALARSAESKIVEAEAENLLALISIDKNDLDSALYHAKISLRLGREINSLLSIEAATRTLNRIYYLKEDYKNAYDYLIQNKKVADSLVNANRLKEIGRVEARQEMRDKQAIAEAIAQKQRMILYFSCGGCIILFAGFVIIKMSNKQILALNQTLVHQKREIQWHSKQLEKANKMIKGTNEQLEQLVSQRTTELYEVNKELDQFLYRSSHDLRGPLSTMMGISNVARLTVRDESALSFFDKIDATVMKMEGMIKKLNQIHLINNYQPVFEIVDFDSLIQKIYERYNVSLGQIDFDYEIQTNGRIRSNVIMLSMILDNLIENSIRFQLRHDEEGSYIKIRIHEADRSIQIEVEDNGKGIPPENIQKVYSLYYRGDISSEGNGLGLYLIKKATEKLGGTISISSKIGEGTTFTLNIPGIEVPVEEKVG